MNTASKLVALALLGCACGPARVSVDSGDETSTGASATSSSSSSSETSTSESTSSGDASPFVPIGDYDGGNWCDPFLQDCFDEEKCVPYGSTGGIWDENKCVLVLGDQPLGAPCIYAGTVEATDDCDASSFCWNVMDINGEAVGTCTPFCWGSLDTPECPEGSYCNFFSDAVFVCTTTCDPIVQDCSDGLACYWANNGFSCNVTTDDVPVGEPCGFINDCALGNSCMSTDTLPSCVGSACCSPFCDLELGDQPCELLPGTACVPFFEENMAPPGYENVGVCILPP